MSAKFAANTLLSAYPAFNLLSKCYQKMKIQKNIRVPKDLAEWMDNHILSNNSLVCYALHLVQQMEANATQQTKATMQILHIPTPEELQKKLPF